MQTFSPIQYLQIDIANSFGLDKTTWDDRLAWFAENEGNLHDLVKQAKEPALFFAGVQAYQKARRGEPIKYPVSLDATASGAQILSALISCEQSALLCNVVDSGDREDLYTNIYELLLARSGGRAIIEHPDVKTAVMTYLYGSTAQPRRVFGAGALLELFYETMREDAPGITDLNESLLGLWQRDAYSHDWVLPDNFHVHVKVMDSVTLDAHFMDQPFGIVQKVNKPMERGLSIGANVVHSIDGMIVREIVRRCKHDRAHVDTLQMLIEQGEYAPVGRADRAKDGMVLTLWSHYEDTGFLSARILDELDGENLMLVDVSVIWKLIQTLPAKPFDVLTVHDCFRVHPNYGNDLRRQYNRLLSEIAGSTMLANIAQQITGQAVTVTPYGDIAQKALEANYALS